MIIPIQKYIFFIKKARKIVLHEIKKYTYTRLIGENEVPIIIVQNNIGDSKIIIDNDVINHYAKYFPNAVVYKENQEKEIKINKQGVINK